jgi:hypothetical protein
VLIVRSSERADADPPEGLAGRVMTRSVDGDHSAVVSEGDQVATFVVDALAALDTTTT